MPVRPSVLARALPLLLLALVACRREDSSAEAETGLTVAAAASLREVMPALVSAYQAGHPGAQVSVTYGASGSLQRQVQGGAPVDAVVLASAAPVDALVDAGLVERESRRVVATNVLVLVGPRGGPRYTFATLDALAPGELLAVGEPGAVPAGHYAREALERLGRWDALRGRLVFGGDVAAVLAYARRGEVAAAIVYGTDVRGAPEVVQLDEARGAWAPRPEVVAGAVRGGRGADFVSFLGSPQAQGLWRAYGFGVP